MATSTAAHRKLVAQEPDDDPRRGVISKHIRSRPSLWWLKLHHGTNFTQARHSRPLIFLLRPSPAQPPRPPAPRKHILLIDLPVVFFRKGIGRQISQHDKSPLEGVVIASTCLFLPSATEKALAEASQGVSAVFFDCCHSRMEDERNVQAIESASFRALGFNLAKCAKSMPRSSCGSRG